MKAGKRKNIEKLKKAALGMITCDLTITNVNLFNVITDEIYPCEVDICDGYIVNVRSFSNTRKANTKEYYDGRGCYLLPGLIDCHVHVESTMMTPENLSRAIVPYGTTTIITDPHEIANVMGIEGVNYMIDNSKNSKLRQFVLAPSCVAATENLEKAGAFFTSKDIEEMLQMDGVIGLAEVMDYIGVINHSKRMSSIVDQAINKEKYIQGHCPFVSGDNLAAYLIGGPVSCHESSTRDEVLEKIRNGMHINLRSSSLDDSSINIAQAINQINDHQFVSICTDDIHAKDILTDGHINGVIKRYIKSGLKGRDLYKMATINAAREYGFSDIGIIAPGYLADMQLINDFDGSCPEAVFISGQLVAEKGKYLLSDEKVSQYQLRNTVCVDQIKSEDDFLMRVPDGYNRDTISVNVVVKTSDRLWRTVEKMDLPVKNGCVDISGDPSLIYVCNCNRHGYNNKTIAIYKDFGLNSGALASTVAHDSHNMNICYHNPKQAYLACEKLKQCGGGVCVVDDEGSCDLIKLPIAGLMSELDCKSISQEIEKVQQKLSKLTDGSVHVLSTAVMSLTVLPSVVISDMGLVDGNKQAFVDIFVND